MTRPVDPTSLVIVGAPRSGTNALRDAIVCLPGATTWGCDEINLVWRHGNRDLPHDQLTPKHARPEVNRYIRARFTRLARNDDAQVVVEKTCANSLRVPFVNTVLPAAKFLFITRDGRSAVASAMERWRAPFDLRYTLRKLRYAPVGDLPFYAMGFVRNRLQGLLSDDGQLASWGPRFPGIDDAIASRPLIDVCTLQWRFCVSGASSALNRLPSERVHRISYAELCHRPRPTLQGVAKFAGLHASDSDLKRAAATISTSSLDRWRNTLTPTQVRRIEKIAGDVLIEVLAAK